MDGRNVCGAEVKKICFNGIVSKIKSVGTSGGHRRYEKDISLKQIGTGKYSDIFAVHKDGESFAMKISYYTEETIDMFMKKKICGDLEGAKREKEKDSILVSEKFSKITSVLLDKKLTPHFVRVFEEQDVKNFAAKIPGLEKRLRTLTAYQKMYNHVAFMDLFDTDLTHLLKRKVLDENEIKIVIFQILYTIAATQHAFPTFRHNDLTTNNVLIRNNRKNTTFRYDVDGMFFYTPTKYYVSVTDYDFVHIPSVKFLINQRVLSGNYKVSGDNNVSYDAHLFIKSVYKCFTEAYENTLDTETHRFLNSLETFEDDRYPNEILSLNPRKILKHEYFNSLKIKPRENPTAIFGF